MTSEVFRIYCGVLSFFSFVTYQGERPRVSDDSAYVAWDPTATDPAVDAGAYVTWDQTATDAPVAIANRLVYTPRHHQNVEQNANAQTRVDSHVICHSPRGDIVALMRRCWVHEPAQRPGG